MARKTFQITFPNGKSKYVTRDERDELLLCQDIQLIKGNEYKYIRETRTLHGLSQLSVVLERMVKQQRQEPDYYPGEFTVELKQRRYSERMQSAEALAIALPQMVAKLSEALVSEMKPTPLVCQKALELFSFVVAG